MSVIKIGATSWGDRGLLRSGWYPPEVKTPEARLRYFASRFPITENDSSYYAVPDPAQTEAWARWAPDGFTLDVKAHALLTAHYARPKQLPPDLREQLSPALREKDRLYARELDQPFLDELAKRMKQALEPLAQAGRLGLVLLQYPVWFVRSRESMKELVRAKRRLEPYRLAVELRNRTWLEAHAGHTLAFLRELDVAYTCVDAPQGFASSVPPLVAVTAPTALLRLHGRNVERWEKKGITAAERFEHFYTDDELRGFVPRVEKLANESEEVHVLFNNCHRDYAVKNAERMTELVAAAEAPHAPQP